MRKICVAAALVVLVLSVAVHLLVLAPAVEVRMGQVWPLHLLTMAALFAALLSWTLSARKLAVGSGAASRREAQKRANRIMLRAIPLGVKIVVVAVAIYGSVIFFSCVAAMHSGAPEEADGEAQLVDDGGEVSERVVEESSPAPIPLVRMFSGEWIFSSLAPLVFFIYSYPALQAATAGGADESAT